MIYTQYRTIVRGAIRYHASRSNAMQYARCAAGRVACCATVQGLDNLAGWQVIKEYA